MSRSPIQPPVPFADFEFSFDPSLSNLFPHPPPLPSSADLFSASETTDLLGFLDNFNWEFENAEPMYNDHVPNILAPYSNPHLNTSPEASTSSRPKPNTRSASSRATVHLSAPTDEPQMEFNTRDVSQARSSTSDSSSTSPPYASPNGNDHSGSSTARTKPLLSTPQKRLNHIMSEQKRRNAIRDGYAQLIALLAPAGSAPGLGMPTRGRPKGSGSRGKGRSKGKSGVLFRAVEYCRWLEEGRDALRDEVMRIESAAGIHHH